MTIPTDLVLEDGRVRLEPLASKHLDDLCANCNNPALWEFTFQSNPFTGAGDARAWLEAAGSAEHQRSFAIVDTASGNAIGSTRFLDIQPEHRKLEIGWTFLAKPFWRTGINRTCKLLLLRYAFETWGAERVQLKSEAINARSRTAMNALGARHEGTLRSFRIRPDGEMRDVSFYSIIASEWPAVRERLAHATARAS